MDLRDKLKDLKLTEDEVGRFTEAFKDENFRQMLRDYAEEISDPDNRRKYEEEITILEQERGNNVDFIHPAPFRCVKTSNGKQKCFINICANDKIGKPSSKSGVSDGKRGLHWSLPHSLHPERKELDSKGNKILIYDVVFHPDTLHIATTNTKFMDMVTSVAIQAIQDAFKDNLDSKNVKVMSTKYKGNPQACVIRKPIPGFEAKEVKDDILAFPYPDENVSKKEETKICQTKPQTSSKEPTQPHYSLKYRSFVDLQDFRCSRDSAQSPRPKEIVVTIDLPLLKSAADANLEVKERSLLLQSVNPVYRLELALAYAVDEERGEAKFNRQKRQMVVTLPVRPSKEKFPFSDCIQNVGEDGEKKDGGEDNIKVESKICEEVVEELSERKEEEVIEEVERKCHGDAKMREREEDRAKMEEIIVTDEMVVKKDVEICQVMEDQRDRAKMEEQEERVSDEKDETGRARRNQEFKVKEEMEVDENDCTEMKSEKSQLESRVQICEDTEESQEKVSVCTEDAQTIPRDVSEPEPVHEPQDETEVKTLVQLCEDTEETHQQQSEKIQACTKEAVPCDVSEPEAERGEVLDVQDLKSEQHFEKPLPPLVQNIDKPRPSVVNLMEKPHPSVVNLREMNQDGTETPITDHVTSAGFSFKNSLLFELD